MRTKMTMARTENNLEITIDEAYKKFIRSKIAMNLSDETIISYNSTYKIFCKYIDKETICNDITIETLYTFIENKKLDSPNISDRTIESYMRHLRAILYFCMDSGYMPYFKISLPKVIDEPKDPFSNEEVLKLMKKPNLKTCDFVHYRNWVISCFLLGSGVRLNTLTNVIIKDIHFDNNFIHLSTVKNKRPYNIPMSAKLREILKEYLTYRNGEDEDYLFCNMYGEVMTKNAFKSALRRYSEQRGVEKHGVHIYRHTFAKFFILGGGSLVELQEILGHCSLEMARRYVKMYSKDLQRDFEKKNPLDVNSEHIEQKKKTKIRMG